MTALARLQATAALYQQLPHLTAELRFTTESGDEHSLTRTEERVRAWYAAPDRIRIEQGGRRGLIHVSDGEHDTHYYGAPHRYTKTKRLKTDLLPGLFQPAFPLAGTPAFLFHDIAQNVIRAEDAPPATVNGTLCHVLTVEYAPAPHPSAEFSPLTIHLDAATGLVRQLAGEARHYIPPLHDRQSIRQTLTALSINTTDAPPPDTFTYTPPADAIDDSNRHGHAGLVTSRLADPIRQLTADHAQYWDVDTLVDEWTLHWQNTPLTLHRRLTRSNGAIQLSERITGPHGPHHHEHTL
jgi:outer membrane lipoprotein-sorting protein